MSSLHCAEWLRELLDVDLPTETKLCFKKKWQFGEISLVLCDLGWWFGVFENHHFLQSKSEGMCFKKENNCLSFEVPETKKDHRIHRQNQLGCLPKSTKSGIQEVEFFLVDFWPHFGGLT